MSSQSAITLEERLLQPLREDTRAGGESKTACRSLRERGEEEIEDVELLGVVVRRIRPLCNLLDVQAPGRD